MVRVVGAVLKFEVEASTREENVDHCYVSVDAGLSSPITLSLNTLSFRNRVAGHDPRVRLATLVWRWTHLPARGLYPLEFFDYETVELLENVEFRGLERSAMEEYFAMRCANCRRIEAWGVAYQRAHPGLHQIHSRRGSEAVAEDLRGRDGAVRFYFDEGQRVELALLKFSGQ
ncbi:MAG: hypothetical protein JHC52_06535 [Chthoniobacterales bacterium]|jgi:hypothetical protein|nr:hypothetical protein [Chthoniobacterales bacterium]